MRTHILAEERKIYHFIVCPHCHGEITYEPDFGVYINYFDSFGGLKTPVLRLQKNLPVLTIMNDPNLTEHKQTLHDLIINIANHQPLICIPIFTKSTPSVLKKMEELGIIKPEEIIHK